MTDYAPGSRARPGPLRRLAGYIVQALANRLSLAGVELQEEVERYLGIGAIAAVAGTVTFVGLLFVNFAIVLAVPDHAQPWVALGLGAFYVVIGGIGIAVTVHRIRSADPPFQATIAELRRDRAAIAGDDPSRAESATRGRA